MIIAFWYGPAEVNRDERRQKRPRPARLLYPFFMQEVGIDPLRALPLASKMPGHQLMYLAHRVMSAN
ncbi:hypothetical protein [Rhizobium aegyptiacum]|uniref:hypothetical protein n=1 Tax=Rhizobium aegyptiacum TaxID=1764550 RepID=UPI0012E958FD|nr:hypothetical protein [Rhizobium aegyptiacum]